VLKTVGLRHAYERVDDEFIYAKLVLPSPEEFKKYGQKPFVPSDLSPVEQASLLRAPSIEVIVKNRLSGTTPKTCEGLAGSAVRMSHNVFPGRPL
jgi:hypothetical protein